MGIGGVDDLVIHVGPVTDISNLVALVLQIAADHVELQRLLGMADVGVAGNGDAAGVHADLLGLYGFKIGLAPGKTVIYLHFFASETDFF